MKQSEKLSEAAIITEFTQPPTQSGRVCGKPKTHIAISYISCFSFFKLSYQFDDDLVTFASTKKILIR